MLAGVLGIGRHVQQEAKGRKGKVNFLSDDFITIGGGGFFRNRVSHFYLVSRQMSPLMQDFKMHIGFPRSPLPFLPQPLRSRVSALADAIVTFFL